MAEFMKYDEKSGVYRRFIREDAVRQRDPDRWCVPTTEKTKWVSTWEEFRSAGGVACWSEDATGIELMLPEPYKFSCKFHDQG